MISTRCRIMLWIKKNMIGLRLFCSFPLLLFPICMSQWSKFSFLSIPLCKASIEDAFRCLSSTVRYITIRYLPLKNYFLALIMPDFVTFFPPKERTKLKKTTPPERPSFHRLSSDPMGNLNQLQ